VEVKVEMRRLIVRAVVGLIVLAPVEYVSAQTSQDRPNVARLSPAAVEWLRSGAPLVLGGSYFYPSGPTVFFDGAVMTRGGSFEGVPVYIDATRDAANVVYVPAASGLMRPYERRRADQNADALARPPLAPPVVEPETPAAIRLPQLPAAEPTVSASGAAYQPAVATVPRAHANRGIWIEFGGRVWLAAGAGGPYWRGRFSRIGTYHGFPVYQESARPDQIFVPSVPGGPVARYSLSNERATAPID
jgi:hypothetical protein